MLSSLLSEQTVKLDTVDSNINKWWRLWWYTTLFSETILPAQLQTKLQRKTFEII